MIFKDQVILVADCANLKGNIYPLKTLQNILDKYKDKQIPGKIGMDTAQMGLGLDINLEDVAFSSKLTRIEDGKLLADVTVLDTPKGNDFEVAVNRSMYLNISFRPACLVDIDDIESINSINNKNIKFKIIEMCQINFTGTPT